jgi:hypothetical protein
MMVNDCVGYASFDGGHDNNGDYDGCNYGGCEYDNGHGDDTNDDGNGGNDVTYGKAMMLVAGC